MLERNKRLLELYNQGKTVKEIAKLFGLSETYTTLVLRITKRREEKEQCQLSKN